MLSGNDKWAALTAFDRELAEAMAELYSLYTPSVVDWLAGLYDSRVGGFYYSNSARDNRTVIYKDKEYLLLPDAESTRQALDLLVSSGVIDSYRDLPNELTDRICYFIISLQDEDGFFYHPQWGKDIRLSRRGRDLSWCLGILRAFGRSPRYATVIDGGRVGAVALPEHLSSPDRFAAYLDSLDIENRSYPAGNEIVAQGSQIKSAGLMEQCVTYLDLKQNKDNGMWHPVSNYFAVNGLLKISGVYSIAGLPMPNAEAAARSAISAITSGEPMGTVVDIYNTWFAVGNVLENMRSHGSAEAAESLVRLLHSLAPGAIRRTREKIALFQKTDGSFSYCQRYSSEISQGTPVAVYHSEEGDVNGTIIAIGGLIENIWRALDMNDMRVPLFGVSERERFFSLIS